MPYVLERYLKLDRREKNKKTKTKTETKTVKNKKTIKIMQDAEREENTIGKAINFSESG